MRFSRILYTVLMLFIVSGYAKGCTHSDMVKYIRDKAYNAGHRCAVSKNDTAAIMLVKWMKMTKSTKDYSFEDITNFIKQHPDLPEKSFLISAAENNITESTNKSVVKSWFAKYKPTTSAGYKFYIKHVIKPEDLNGNAGLVKTLRDYWVHSNFSDTEEREFFKQYREYLQKDDIIRKIDRKLFRDGKLDYSLVSLVGATEANIFQAKYDLLRNKNMDDALDRVPNDSKDEQGLLYAQAIWLKNNKQDLSLARFISKSPEIKELSSDKWTQTRKVLAVNMLDEGEHSLAYDVAARHLCTDPANYFDSELLAGKIAYFYLDEPKIALKHFNNMLANSKYSLSIAKAAYWAGMAEAAINGMDDAEPYFNKAAMYPDTYYGQLSIMALNGNKKVRFSIADNKPKITPEDVSWLHNNIFARASHILAEAGEHHAARKFVHAATATATNDAQKYLLTQFGIKNNIHLVSVVCGKEIARRGTLFIDETYPMLHIKGAQNYDIEKALVFAIIRQESEFDKYARSGAGAMGLMQLMYGTARDIGSELNKRFTKTSLYHDHHLNATLGTHYLTKLLAQYNGSYVLAIAAYNAGPGNVDKWIKKNGDPRNLSKVTQVVEWIEKIPFYETRSYVQHVLGNLQMYRSRIASMKDGKQGPTEFIEISLDEDLLRGQN